MWRILYLLAMVSVLGCGKSKSDLIWELSYEERELEKLHGLLASQKEALQTDVLLKQKRAAETVTAAEVTANPNAWEKDNPRFKEIEADFNRRLKAIHDEIEPKIAEQRKKIAGLKQQIDAMK